MNVFEAIAQRRSIKKFLDRPVPREAIEAVLQAATLAPNHRTTQPWRFYVLGPGARRNYGLALGERKARKLTDSDAAQAVRQRTAEEYFAMPCMIAVAMVVSENPEIREEDYAAVMMGVENLLLAAVERGLGAHIRTGAVMDDVAARSAAGARDGERIVAVVTLGVPEEVPPTKERQPASALTTWME